MNHLHNEGECDFHVSNLVTKPSLLVHFLPVYGKFTLANHTLSVQLHDTWESQVITCKKWCFHMLTYSIFTGTLSELEPSKKRFPVKVVFIVVLLCLVLTAIGLAAIMLWHVYRKDKQPVQWASSSSDRLTSCSSAVNIMSHGSSPMPVYKGYLDSSVPCMGKYSYMQFLLDYIFCFKIFLQKK